MKLRMLQIFLYIFLLAGCSWFSDSTVYLSEFEFSKTSYITTVGKSVTLYLDVFPVSAREQVTYQYDTSDTSTSSVYPEDLYATFYATEAGIYTVSCYLPEADQTAYTTVIVE